MAFVISSSVTVDLFFVVQKPALRVGNNIPAARTLAHSGKTEQFTRAP